MGKIENKRISGRNLPGKLFSDNFRANLKIDQDMLY